MLFFGADYEAEAQMSRRKIKQNNRRMRNFKGTKNVFKNGRAYSYFGFTANSMNYFGDLAPLTRRTSTDFSFTKPAVGLNFAHRFGPFYTFRGGFTYGTLEGNDFVSQDPYGESSKYRYVRNLSFKNKIWELSAVGVFDLFKNLNTYVSRQKFTPYGFIGLALYYHNPQGLVSPDSGLPEAGTWVDLQPLGTEGQFSDLPETSKNHGLKPYNRVQLSVPVGIGMRYKLTDLMDFSMEIGYRYLFTDYIDDVSNNYVDLELLPSDLSRAMSDRSQEVNSSTGEPRDFEAINATISPLLYTTPGGYTVYRGYGHEHWANTRGNKKDKDIYVVTTLRLTYIIGKTFRKAKFR